MFSVRDLNNQRGGNLHSIFLEWCTDLVRKVYWEHLGEMRNKFDIFMWGQFMEHPIIKEAIILPTLLALAFFCSYIYIIFHDITMASVQEHFFSLQ